MHNHIWLCTIAKSKKRKKGFLFSIQFKIIFLCLFFFFFYSFILQSPNHASLSKDNLLSNLLSTHSLKLLPLCLTFSQTHSLKLSPLCLTAVGPTRSSMSLAHWSSTSPTHQLTHFVELPSRRSTRLTHLNLLWCSQLSQTLTSKLSPLYPAATADPRLQPDSPLGELSLSSSFTCLGFFIWVIGMIN